MHIRSYFMIAAMLVVTACDTNFTPREKVATYDPATRELTLPHPCPDWSQSQTQNHKNERHSNFGCAVNTNLAVQVESPVDLDHGHGKVGPDTETTTGIVQQYRVGKLPAPLTPVQTDSSTGQ